MHARTDLAGTLILAGDAGRTQRAASVASWAGPRRPLRAPQSLRAAMRFLVAVAYEGDPSASAYSHFEAGSSVTTTAMGRSLCFLDAELEAQWQRHCGASLQGLDFSALLLCGALQVREPLFRLLHCLVHRVLQHSCARAWCRGAADLLRMCRSC